MKQNLIIYSTTDGHTEAICKYIKSLLQKDFNTTLVPLHNLDKLNLNHFDMIIIGASIRYGKHKPELYQFIKENINILNNVKTAFFSVNAVARNLEKNKPETNPYMQKFLKISNWQPNKLAVFAGKVDYPNYGFFDKHIIRLIMFITKGPTDTSRSFEFTDLVSNLIGVLIALIIYWRFRK